MKESITNYRLLLSLAQKGDFEFEHVRTFRIVPGTAAQALRKHWT